MSLHAILLDPSLEARQSFKKVSEEHGGFKKISASSTLGEGVERVKICAKNNPCDVIYISTRFDPVIVGHFIETSRTILPKSVPAPHLVVISRNTKNVPTKQFDVSNPDGFMLEPVVPKDLNGSVDFVEKFKEKSQSVKSKEEYDINFKVLCMKLALAVDKGKMGLRNLKELNAKLSEFPEEVREQYYSQLIDHFTMIQPPKVINTSKVNRDIKVVRRL